MAVSDLLEVYAPIMKKERDPKTGHLYVYGKITGSDLDHSQQRMDPAWLKTAVPDWFRIGNIRLQHNPQTAVGKAVELEEKADGWYIGAKVVDQDAIVKVEEDVLTGFSIGVRGHRLDFTNKADAPNGTCVAGRIVETSLVDAPCLGSAKISDHWRLPLAKADGSGELQAVEAPVLERAASPTYGLPAELFDRLASPVKQALADLASTGAQIAAEAEPAPAEPEAAKSDSAEATTPLVVNVTVLAAPAEADGAPEDTPDPDQEYLELAEAADLFKADFTAAERRKYAAAGVAMPDGSFPIPSKSYLRKAIKAVGRGGADHDSIRAHIIKRATALGQEAMVPDNWNKDGSLKDTEAAKALLADLAGLGFTPEVAKAEGDEDDAGAAPAEDVADAKSAIAILGKLIVSEAKSLAVGNLNEACDISLLLQAVNSLKWFIQAENREPVNADGDEINLADAPDEGEGLLKAEAKNGGKLAPPFKKKGADGDESDADDGEDASEDDEKPSTKKTPAKMATKADAPGEPNQPAETPLTKAEAAEIVKAAVAAALAADEGTTKTSPAPEPETVTKADLTDLVKAAVAEARSADQERIEALTADLTKATGEIEAIKAMPIPGGPVLTRTAAQQGEATRSDAQRLMAEADVLMAKADAFPANPDLAQGYRDRARALRAKALV